MTALDDYLTQNMFGDDAIRAVVKLFCRRQSDGVFKRKRIKRTMIIGAAVDADVMQPGADEDQLICGEIIILPRQIYTVTSHELSPGHGMRADQILVRPESFEPRFWDKRLK